MLQENSRNTASDIHVSILIRTKNEERYIGQTLSALFSQSYKYYEVLIVDSGSTDRTLEISRNYPVKIYEIKAEDFTWGYALNYGFQKAAGTYVICLSAHALPLSEDWLETLISNFDDKHIAAVMSNTLPWPDCNPFDRRGLLKKFNMQKQELTEDQPFIFGNTSSAIRKDIWKKIPFDESLSYCEDHDWIAKVRKLNYRIIFEPNAKVYHSHNESLAKIYARSYQESCAREVLKIQKFSLTGLMLDLFAGTVYDMLYVLIKGDNLKWLLFAPLRRFVINYARFKANRTLCKSAKDS
jgi:glycosyltransferase involved in cell wall biosynthesis